MTSYIYNMVDTWASGGGPYTSIKMNATDNDTGSASLLMDLQVGGASRFRVTKAGEAVFASNSFVGDTGGSLGRMSFNTSMPYVVLGGSGTGYFGLANTNVQVADVILSRRAAANLRLGAADTTGTTAPTPQFLSAQSWASSTNNDQPGANFTIDGSQGTGTGAGGSIIFRVAPAGSTSNGVQNALQNTFIVGSGEVRVVNTLGASGNLSIAATSNTNITTTFRFQTNTDGTGGSNAGFIGRISGNFGVHSAGGTLIVGALANSGDSIGIWGTDVRLARDAANTLAQRNGANAQAFRVYNTYTDATTFERANFYWDSNVLKIGTEKGSVGGTARALELQTDGTSRWSIGATTGHLLAGADNTYDIGASGATRPRNVYVAGAVTTGSVVSSITKCSNFNTENNTHTVLTFTNSSDNLLFATGGTSPRINFCGTTSSFPALKRSSTTLQARLADDSDYGSIQGKLTTENAYTAGAPTATGYIVLYDSTGTAYKIPAEAL